MIRLNMSHGDKKWHRQIIKELKQSIERLYCRHGGSFCPPAVVVDLRGPDIRTGEFNVSTNLTVIKLN